MLFQRGMTIIAVTTVSFATLAGCHHSTPPTPSKSAPSNHTAQKQADTVEAKAADIAMAPDAQSEAAALERFRKWCADRGYTYVVNTLRTDGAGTVPNPTAQRGPIRVEVQVYQAQRPLHTFRFTPKDNRNVGIISAG